MDLELNEELRFHFDNEVEKYKRAGMREDAARRRARLVFGGHQQVKEDCQDARGISFLETTTQDVRYSLRAMRKNPGFFSIAALTLALGIGASIAVFSLVNTILLKPLPYPNANRVVMLWREGPLAGVGDMPWAPGEYSVLARAATAFQNLGAFKKDSFNLTGASSPELLEGVRASAGLFPALGVSPLLGRTFTAEEDQPGYDHVTVLSNRLWQSRFGGDTGIVGKIIDLNGYPYTVIGVMPKSFTFPNQDGIPPILDLPKETQLWVPLALPVAPKGANELGVIGQLKSNGTLGMVVQDMNVTERSLEEHIPQEKGWSSRVVLLTQQTVTDARRPLLLLLGAVSVVLLIACANVAGLTLNRSLGRRRELTLRGALGAGRSRLVRQLMTESLLLAFVGGIMGILFGEASLYLVKHFGPDSIPHLHETGLDLRLIGFALGITLITGLLFGLAPAVGATRMNMVEALKEGGQRSVGSATAPRIRNALLIAQVAMALVLVVASGLLVRTFYSMLRSDAGFDVARIVTFELPLPTSKYADTGRMAQLYQQVLLRLQSVPGVRSAGFASVVPMGGAPDGTVIRMPEHPTTKRSEQPYANYSFASPGYFATMGTPLLRGRDFSDADTLNSVPVVIISSSMAKKYFHGEDPVGKQVGVATTKIPVRTIIGVVANIKHASLREEPDPEMFVPYTQNEIKVWPSMQTMQFAVRSRTDQTAIAESVRQAVHAVDPDLPVAKFATLATLVDRSMTADRFSMLLVGSFGVLALILASIGMYGVISYSVMQRTPEIGVRIALGAQRTQIFVMILRQASRLAVSGIAIGLIAALGATRLMTRFLYGVQPADPITFAVVSLLLASVAFLACYVPARKAMKVDPMIALRYE
ncbi:putative permease [Granulicella arctica]|uniref:Putative permease n=2 Tax=Granulicella arctica TaxID=940613 RepID=A0A7Y9TJX3_9BACT|nr:putative permease [Granulicella arctica]